MANNRGNNVELNVAPGATTESVDKLMKEIKVGVGKSSAEAYVTLLANVTEAFSKTLVMGHNISKQFLTYFNTPSGQKSAALDVLMPAYKEWQERLKSQKSLGLMVIPPLTEQTLQSIPEAYRNKITESHQLVTKMKSTVGDLIKSHQDTFKKIGDTWKDLNNRQKAAASGVQPIPAQHSAPLSSSHGARNQASAQAAANSNNSPANASQAEEKQQQKR